MICVDSSALIEIAIGASQADDCRHALIEAERLVMSAATVTETLIVAFGRSAESRLRAVLDRFGIEVVPLTDQRARAAAAAYRRYGKGWHAAGLNFGDCFAYALAREYDCPLLFVGRGFALTDVRPAIG